VKQLPITPQPALRVLLAVSVFTALSGNQAFFAGVNGVYPWESGNALFVASLAMLVVALTLLLMVIVASILGTRVTASLFLVVAAAAGYFADTFGVVIDTSMLVNALQTDTAEVRDLLGGDLVARLLLSGVVPSVIVWFIPIRPARLTARLGQNAVAAIASVAVVVLCMLPFGAEYASFLREHKPLRQYANPVFPVYSMGRLVFDVFHVEASAEAGVLAVGTDATIPEDDEGSELIVMVVGETARRDRFSLNGYARDTTPYLAAEPNVVSYRNTTACGTSTAVSVPCMFSMLDRKHFDLHDAGHRENVLDILVRSGVSVLWRDNNSGSKGVADRVPFEDFRSPDLNPVCDTECRDVGMLAGLQKFVDTHDGDILIVLHQMGNHGPAYFKRYPESFEYFTPACHSIELSTCSQEEIDNAYDNAIRYTDYFLSEVIAFLKDNTPAYETAMLYVSDHGESLGENGMYLHGAPYVFAPSEQVDVAVITWLGASADFDLQSALVFRDAASTHDSVSQALLRLFEVESAQVDTGEQLFFAVDGDAD
jgi:lipid A ethanolaminephosphotransferase